MKAAIYYPHLTIQSEGLLKRALLFWDQVEIITPHDGFDFRPTNGFREAIELIAKPHVPSELEKVEAHEQLMAFADKPLPDWFYLKSRPPANFIYTRKFMPQTWGELRERGLAHANSKQAEEYWSSTSFALLMMGVLADCCAGKTKVTVTDEQDAYQAIENSLAADTNAIQRTPIAGDKVLVRTNILAPRLENIKFSKLIALRKKELGKGGHQYRTLRHNLFAEIARFAEDQVSQDFSASDREELERQFIQRLNDDFAALRTELGEAKNNWIFSKEMVALVGTSALTAIGAVAMPVSVPIAVGAASLSAAGLRNKFKAERHKALVGHFSSYLYLASK
jgi:hypothetical protein